MTRLLEDKELSLYSLEHMYSICSTFLSEGMDRTTGVFDLLIRDMPLHRNFLVAAGQEAVIQYLHNLRYSNDQIDYLLEHKRISKPFASYLKNFKFTGDVYAMPGGTIYFPGGPEAALMVDMYQVTQGVRNAVRVADEMKARDERLNGVVIDSGDVLQLSRYGRKELDRVGHRETKISVTGNLDEYKIASLIKKRIPANNFLVVTEVITSPDAPKLETVYKLVEFREGRNIKYTAKFSPGKISLPGRKQVFRVFKNGRMVKDIIGLENEKGLGKPLLEKVMEKGRIVKSLPSPDHIRAYVDSQLKQLPPKLHDIEKQHPYPVQISRKVKALLEQVRKEHCG